MTYAIELIVGYFVALAVVSAAAIPYRRRMRVLLSELRGGDMSENERFFVEWLAGTAYSWRSAVLLAMIYASGVFQSANLIERQSRDFDARNPTFARNRVLHDLMDAYFVSIVAVNPLFGLLAVVCRAAFRVRFRVSRSGDVVHAVDARVALAAM